MDIICDSLEDFERLTKLQGACDWTYQLWTDAGYVDVWTSYHGLDGNQYILPRTALTGKSVSVTNNVDVNIEEIKNQILEEIGINNEETEELEVVSEAYSQGYLYQLTRKEITRDEFKRSRKIKRKRTSKTGDFRGVERGAC